MQQTVTINIPDTLKPIIENIDNFDKFISDITIKALRHSDKKQNKNEQLAEAVKIMFDEYMNDEELTSFTTLDGEPVYE